MDLMLGGPMDPLRSALIVDNESGFHLILKMVLEPLGFSADSAFDGRQGWALFQSKLYDVVLSDVHMPHMSGPELFDQIRRTRPAQPIVMMTSGSDPDGSFEARVEGKKATACIYKPFEIVEVVNAVQQVLGVELNEAMGGAK